ncbi:MAG: adenylate/guanylate cyclase domain-containing protein [Pseudomonadota bacterium]
MNQVIARKQVSYEVYIKDRSGKWVIHAHYNSAQKKAAEEEALTLERMSHVQAVKVIREVYHNDSNRSEDYIIYQTRGSGKKTEAVAQPKVKSGNDNRPAAKTPEPQAESLDDMPVIDRVRHKPAAQSGETGFVGLILKVVLIFCAALGIGLVAMLGAARLLEYLPGVGIAISQGFYDKANFIAFIVGFLASAVPMLMSVTRKIRGPKNSGGTNEAPRPRTTSTARTTGRPARRSMPGNREIPDSATDATDADETPESTPEDSTDTAAPEITPVPDTPALHATRQTMKSFISGSIETIRRNIPGMDAYHKFGINLYVAGACDACSEKNALPMQDGRIILKDCITALGANGSMADTFCKNVDQYLLEPKYKDMYGAGRSSMDSYMKDETSITTSVSQAITQWSAQPAAAGAAPAGKKLHALMFTDIVNSTQMTQELGDIGAQKMVHAHNNIVRTALLNNYGKEVKHMGDGIMAVFPSSASAVEAALEIQKNMAAHNQRGDLVFKVRIGINAGEAITEENDLFGTVVQLAARVCAAAGADEVLVSSAVRDTYAGSRAAFTSRGSKAMKGFASPIEVFAATSR